MQNGYHTAKVEWIKDEPIPEDELGNLPIQFLKQFIIIYFKNHFFENVNFNL